MIAKKNIGHSRLLPRLFVDIFSRVFPPRPHHESTAGKNKCHLGLHSFESAPPGIFPDRAT